MNDDQKPPVPTLASPTRISSRHEPLLQSEDAHLKSRSRKTPSKVKRLRSLKLRILDTDNDEEVPVYRPPAYKDPDSEDDITIDDKYSVTAAAPAQDHNESTWEKRDILQSASSIIGEADEILMWTKDESQHADSSLPPLVRPVEQRMDHPPDSRDDTDADVADEIESVWTSHGSEAASDQNAAITVFTKETRFGDTDSKTEQTPFGPSGQVDSVVEAPRKTAHFSETIKSKMSSHDVESGVFLGINSNSEEIWSGSEDAVVVLKQKVAYVCIVLTAIQLGVLFIQLTLCGMASLDINPMIGPYPDAFSEWGGKNAYLLVEKRQYFRIITPVFLHVGVIHFVINAFCQLETCAYFEREWGSWQWLTIYLISGIGSVLASSAIDPDVIGVSSSGALMGMFGAKIAHVVTWNIFELKSSVLEESARFDDLSGVLCSAAMLSLLSFFTFIDWSGHVGGLLAGIFTGMILFARPIAKRSRRFIWALLGIVGIVTGCSILSKTLMKVELDEELGDACQYFRALYPDGYVCECVWDE
jgi:membrane associated rhomboid family serine protease